MISIEVTGLEGLEKNLMALGEDIAVKVVRDAGMKAMQPVMNDMKRSAGFNLKNTGEHMRDTIRIRSLNRMTDARWVTMMTFKVGPTTSHTMKARAQEFGTRKQVAKPFMRPALDNNIPKIINTLAQEIRQGINRYNRSES
ncbi:HK97 gp10 family phage protein [Salmonella enterica]|nr:HK97 gp10 family phage protein [Salmonella enterica]EBA9765549.1 HK97 gp10 family phage protein [Salmonella enterica]EEB5699302.1 hypothetical protein [Salmonella enterica]EGX5144514.1 hypothetical protein [Salmonella enterica]ELF4900213.1 HK97 gp10 family phage protein [Salmonella enterica]